MTILRLAYKRLGVVFSFFIGLLSLLHLVRENPTDAFEREPAAQPVTPPPWHGCRRWEIREKAILEKQVAQQAPPPAPMPVAHRIMIAQPQNHSRPQDDTWWVGMPLVLRLALPPVVGPPPGEQLMLPLSE